MTKRSESVSIRDLWSPDREKRKKEKAVRKNEVGWQLKGTHALTSQSRSMQVLRAPFFLSRVCVGMEWNGMREEGCLLRKKQKKEEGGKIVRAHRCSLPQHKRDQKGRGSLILPPTAYPKDAFSTWPFS